MEAIIIAIIAYYLILLNRRQRKTKAIPDKMIFAAGIVMGVCYVALLTYYYEITGTIWSNDDWYSSGYYGLIILTEAVLIYSYRRVEQNETKLEVDLDKKARELVDSENEQRDAMDKVTRRHTIELIDGAHQVSTVLRDNVRKPLKTMRQALYHLREDPEGSELAMKTLDENLNILEGAVEELSNSTSFGPLKKTLVDIGDLVSKILDGEEIPENIKVEMDLGEGFSAINLDAPKMMRALANIVDNAVEAMPKGGKLRVQVVRSKSSVLVTVTDSGTGIPDIVKPNSLGFGLFYAKDIIEAHGGKIEYNSVEGKGTTFMVTLPFIA
jgi:signal transduction histidine kinase